MYDFLYLHVVSVDTKAQHSKRWTRASNPGLLDSDYSVVSVGRCHRHIVARSCFRIEAEAPDDDSGTETDRLVVCRIGTVRSLGAPYLSEY